MTRILITSTRSWAGKTTVALGLALNSPKGCGYIKPLWDRVAASEDGAADVDVELMAAVEGASAPPEHLVLPGDYANNLSCVPPANVESSLVDLASRVRADLDGPLLIEGPSNFSFGLSLGLDAATLARYINARVLILADGDLGVVSDKLKLCLGHFRSAGVEVAGCVINKVGAGEADDFRARTEACFAEDEIRLLGVLPNEPLLSRMKVGQVLEELNGKLLAGEAGLERTVGQILVGAMTVETTVKTPLFHTPDKLLITGSDRIGLQIATLETSVAGMVLTGGKYPDPKVVALADDKDVPLILVRPDTFTITSQAERMRARTRADEADKIELVRDMVRESLDISGLF